MIKIFQIFENKAVWLAGLILVSFAALRWIPEKNIGFYPTGFDTVSAYPFYFSTPITFWQSIADFNLLHWIFYTTHSAFKIDIWLAIKLWSVLLYGAVAASFYIFLDKGLKLEKTPAVYITIIFALSMPMMRLSWDLLRNELGLVWLFLFMTQMEMIISGDRKTKIYEYLAALMFGLLVFFSHQMATIILFLYLVAKLIAGLLGSRHIYVEISGVVLIFVIVSFAPGIFSGYKLLGVDVWQYYNIVDITRSSPVVINSQFIADYFYFLYFPLILFTVIGLTVKRNLTLLAVMILFLLLSFSQVIYGGAGFAFWDRWMYFLIIPMAYFSYFGMEFLGRWLHRIFALPKEIFVMVTILVVCWKPIAYLNSGAQNTVSALGLPSGETGLYLPSKMAENAIGEFNQPENKDFFVWFREAVNFEDSLVIVDHAIEGFFKINDPETPLLAANYLQLTKAQSDYLASYKKEFYTVNSTFGLKNYTREYQRGTIKVYRFN